MKRYLVIPSLALLLIVLVFFLVPTNGLETAPNQLVQKVASGLLVLVFVSLIIERAVEVFMTNLKGSEIANDVLAQDKAKQHAIVQAPASAMSLGKWSLVVSDAQMAQANQDLAKAQQDAAAFRKEQAVALQDHGQSRTRLAARISFVFGLLAAMVAFRGLGLTLGQFDVDAIQQTANQQAQLLIFGFEVPLVGPHLHVQLYHTFDVFLSALLLAGGADGIHRIFKRFGVFQSHH